MKYNILFSDAVKPTSWGGVEKWTLQTAKNIEETGHCSIVICRKGSLFQQKVQAEKLSYATIPFCNSIDIWSVLQIYRIIKQKNIHIVICSTNLDIKLAGLAGRIAGIPVISRQGLALISNKTKYKILIKYFTNSIVTNTFSIKQQYESYPWFPKNHIRVIYNGVDIHPRLFPEKTIRQLREHYHIEPDEKVILSCGRLNHQKGFSFLIEAARLAAEAQQKWKFIILGEGNQRKLLETQIHNNRLSNIILAGHQEETGKFYQMADIFVLSSLFEGTPNVVLEAMTHRLPVIATAVNGVKEIIEHGENGYTIPPQNAQAIYKQLEQILSDTIMLNQLQEAGYETVKNKFSWERFTSEFNNYLTDVINHYEKNHHKNS